MPVRSYKPMTKAYGCLCAGSRSTQRLFMRLCSSAPGLMLAWQVMKERIEFAGAVLQMQPKLQYVRRKQDAKAAAAAAAPSAAPAAEAAPVEASPSGPLPPSTPQEGPRVWLSIRSACVTLPAVCPKP